MATAIQALLAECENRSQDKGVLRIRDNATKKWGEFYLYNGRVYYARTEDAPLRYIDRLLKTGRPVDTARLENALAIAKGEESPSLPAVFLQHQIADDADVKEVLKDFFFQSSALIMDWQSVRTRWLRQPMNTSDVVMQIEGGRLVEGIAKRHERMRSMAEAVGVSFDQLFSDVYVSGREVVLSDEGLGYDEQAVKSLATQRSVNVNDLVTALGLTPYSALRATYRLWVEDHVDLFIGDRDLRDDDTDNEEEDLSFELPAVDEIPAPVHDSASEEASVVASAADDLDDDKEDEEPTFSLRPADDNDPLGLGDYGTTDNYVPDENFDKKFEEVLIATVAVEPSTDATSMTDLPADTETEIDSMPPLPSIPQRSMASVADDDDQPLTFAPEASTPATSVPAPTSAPVADAVPAPAVSTSVDDDGGVSDLIAQLQGVLAQINARKTAVKAQLDDVTQKSSALDEEEASLSAESAELARQLTELNRRISENDDRRTEVSSRRVALTEEKARLERSMEEIQAAANSVNLQ